MTELVPKSTSTSVDRPRAATTPDGLDVDAGKWVGTVLEFAELGAVLPVATSALVGEAAVELRGVRRRKDQSYYRRRVGWRAERNRVVVVEVDQRLTPRPDGRFGPTGPWEITSVQIHPAADCTRRTGDVAHDTDLRQGPGSPGVQSASATSALGPNEEHVSYLPRDARAGFVRAIPRPTVAVAEAVRYYGSDGQTQRHTVRALRLDASGAVVIIGSRQASAASWQIEQVSYRFPATELASAPPRAGIDR